MVTRRTRRWVVLHRFDWQEAVDNLSCVTSLCWRPDGKVVVLGLEDDTVLLHDFENGKLLRSLESHMVAVVSQLGGGCLIE
ncbi:anaphase-promoting complex subunit 4-like isoform X1 [Syzygium oleosum]|uniref:anaphase-promoting complex subunit 4-like isoform X1 n=1 Tax=Syzygium oleosum TaxID=219896 RepID=UPI0024BB77A5|nr:anaphase-promoting complex subunit 4-like isoform X1 [Syzygium oleosum]